MPVQTKRRDKDAAGIDDVAGLAGVSQSTVSNVLNHPERVAPTTLDRVQRAIAMLQYVPNGAARSLAAGASTSVGLILSDLGNSLFVDIARGAEKSAEEIGLAVVLANTDGRLDRERRALDVFEQSMVLGSLLTLNDADHFRAKFSQQCRAIRPRDIAPEIENADALQNSPHRCFPFCS